MILASKRHINPKPKEKGVYIIKQLSKDDMPVEYYTIDIYDDDRWLYGDSFGCKILSIVKKMDNGSSYTELKKEVNKLNHFNKQ